MRVRLSNFFSKCAVVSAGVLATFGVANAQLGGGSDLLRQSPQTNQFIENLGQWDSRALFVAGQPGMDYWVTNKGIKVDMYKIEGSQSPSGGLESTGDTNIDNLTRRGHVIAYELVGAGATSEPWGYQASDVMYDYFVGPTSKHARSVRAYGEAYIKSVLPGVHMRNYLENGTPRYDVIVEPGADPTQVIFDIKGADRVYIDAKGDLVVETDMGLLRHSGLYAYQPVGNMQMNVEAQFVMLDSNTVAVQLGAYDSRLPVIIDPLVYGSYVGSNPLPGGGSTGWETLKAVTADDKGNLFLTGSTTSTSFPITNGVYGNFALSGAQDAFLMRLAGDAYDMSYVAYVGGSGVDSGLGIGLDNSTGELWISGTTASANFPGVVNGTALVNATDIFLSKFTVDNLGVVTPNFSTYYATAGPAMTWSDMEVSQSGVVYVAGTGSAADLGAFADFLADAGGATDGWVTSFASDGTVGYQKLIGGVGTDSLNGLAVDSNDNVVVAGAFGFAGTEDTSVTSPPSFPTTAGVFENGRFIRNGDAYIVKLDSAGVTVFSALLGGASFEVVADVAVDQFGDIFVMGRTSSFDFPRNHGAFDENFSGSTEGYATKIEEDGSVLLYSTGLQTSGNVIPTEIAVDERGVAILGGVVSFIHPGPSPAATIPGSIPIVGGIDGAYDCGDNTVNPPNNPPAATDWPSTNDGFIMFLNAAGTGLLYSDYMGECGNEIVNDIIVDSVGATWIAGDTTVVYNGNGAPQTPTGMGVYITGNADKNVVSGNQDGFAIKLRVDLPILNSVAFDPQQIAGGLGASSIATVTLRDPAPPGGVTMSASLTNATATSFSQTPGDTTAVFVIGEGLTSTTIEVFSLAVTLQQTSDLRVTLDNDFLEDRLTVKPWLDDFSASPSTIVGGNQLTVRTTLFDVAPVPIVVGLSTNRPELVTLPAQMTVPAGASTAAILVDSQGVVTDQDLTITAVLLGVAKDADATLIPATVQTLSFDPSTVNGGSSSTGTVTLNGAAGADRAVTISYVAGEAGVTVDGNALPFDVTILAGARDVTFSMETPFAATPTFATVNGSDGGTSANGTLFIEDMDIEELIINPATDVISGSVLTGSVRLTRAAGVGGFEVDLGNSNTDAGELSETSVTIPEGSKISPTFEFTAAVVSADEVTTLSATKAGFTTAQVVVTVRAIDLSIALVPTSVVGGVEDSVATLTLTAPAPVGGLVIDLASSDGSVASVPATATIPAGATTVDFPVTSLVTPVDRIINISATASPAVSDSTNLLVLTPGIVSLVIDPSSVTGPGAAQATVTLSTAAPEDGLDVAISANPASVVSLPSTVNVPEGQTSVTFQIGTSAVNFNTDVTVTVSIGSSFDSAVLTVRSPSVSGITFSPPMVQGGGIAIGTISLDQPAPAGGITVDLTSFNTLLASIVGPTTILIPEGSSSGNFSVQTVRVSRIRSVMFQGGPAGTTQFATGLLYIKP